MEHRFVRRAIESDSDFAFWRFSPDNQTDWVEKPIIVPSCHRGPKCFEVDWNWLNIWSLEENVSSPVSPPGEEGDGFVVDSKLFLQIMKMFQLPSNTMSIKYIESQGETLKTWTSFSLFSWAWWSVRVWTRLANAKEINCQLSSYGKLIFKSGTCSALRCQPGVFISILKVVWKEEFPSHLVLNMI